MRCAVPRDDISRELRGCSFDERCDAVSAVSRPRARGSWRVPGPPYHAALWRGDPAASDFAEWLAGFWEPDLERPDGNPDARSALAADGRGIEWFERDGWVYGVVPESRRRIPAALAWQSWGNPGRGSSRPRPSREKDVCQARDRFLRYDGPGTNVPGFLRLYSSSRPRRRRRWLARQTTFHDGQRQRQHHDRSRLGHPDPDQPQLVPDPRSGDLDTGGRSAPGRVP